MLFLLIRTVSAEPGIILDVIPIKYTVAPGETATYQVNITSITTEYKNITLLIEDPKKGWKYTFDKKNYTISPGKSVYSDLYITVPIGTAPGKYYHTINATAYLPDAKTIVTPEFPSIAIPALISLGIIFLMLSRKQKSKTQ